MKTLPSLSEALISCHVMLNKVSHPHQTIGTKPIAHIDHFTPEMLGTAELVEEVNLDGSGKLVKVCIRLGLWTEALDDSEQIL